MKKYKYPEWEQRDLDIKNMRERWRKNQVGLYRHHVLLAAYWTKDLTSATRWTKLWRCWWHATLAIIFWLCGSNDKKQNAAIQKFFEKNLR